MSQFHNIPQTNGPPPPPIQGPPPPQQQQQQHLQHHHPPPPPPLQHILNNSYNGTQQQQQQHHQQHVNSATSAGLLKISNLPSDLTRREATLIFSLVIDEMLSIEIKDYQIYAVFKNINTCITTGKLLDGKYIFGNEYPPINVEYENNSLLGSPTNMSTTQSAFNSLRLSTSSASNISPPNITNLSLHHQNSNPSLGNGNANQNTNPNQSQTQHQHQHQHQHPNANANANTNANVPFDITQKRQSIGNQRSRFVFSDPFSQEQQQQQQQVQQVQQQQQQQQQHQQQNQNQAQGNQNQQQPPPIIPSGINSGPPSTGPTALDLCEMSGKSILLMESQNDAREYENLVRDSWDPSHTNTGIPLLSSNPQTPGVNSNIDWNNSNNGLNGTNQAPDRRRTSSAFFNTAPALHTMTSDQSNPQLSQQKGPTAAGLRAALQQPEAPQSHQQLLQQQQHPHQQQAQQQQQPQLGPVPQPVNNQSNQPGLHVSPPSLQQNQQPSQQQQQQQQQISKPSTTPSQQATTSPPTHRSSSTTSKDIPDLSLLARVPPPANPADQNPPCNTLYVGNLPPDATETELRTLFAPQKGFRRLSFRTKNQSSTNGSGTSSHSHGPMCFVEFEDVAHATRALAELYGRALPRANGSNAKGGIRLSFSKNPLGVRGPGNPRRTSTNSATPNGVSQGQQQQQQQQQSQQSVQSQQGGNSGFQK